jgi:hypothetical protein
MIVGLYALAGLFFMGCLHSLTVLYGMYTFAGLPIWGVCIRWTVLYWVYVFAGLRHSEDSANAEAIGLTLEPFAPVD